ncbi:DUF885 domain-containing protein [Brevundimonas mediterranea]|uniref:DUF885 family protein n=1 Tax=Brevundimonas mediterranea TaxID=74329 RepID=A0A7Z8Y250_9CAUL|nr:DUF885 family protein [Brevundimonas mediterranea]VDC49475.1 hypothetical protein BREV_BREV_01259 [Brevundimonas mediterranea]
MIDRRRLLQTGALAGVAAFAAPAFARDQTAAAAADALVARIGEQAVDINPQLATNLGLDTGPRAGLKSALAGRGLQDRARAIALNEAWLAEIRAIDASSLTGQSAASFGVVRFQAEALDAAKGFGYGDFGFVDPSVYPLQPYTVSQLTGAYQATPDFLDTQHSIETAADAEAYLSRLSAFAQVLDQETEASGHDADRGVIPPIFIVAKALDQMRALRAPTAAETGLSRSIARRTAEKGIAGDWSGRAAVIVEREIYPALERQIALLETWRPRATTDAGLWARPQGEAYYAANLRLMTTTDLAPETIHQMGLDQSRDILSRMDALLKAEGMTEGTVGRRMAALGRQPSQIYPNTEAGKARILADLNAQIADMEARLPQYFGRLPKARVEVRRVPVAIEAGAPGGYAVAPSLDGSRPGAFYINLRDTAECPRFSLPTLAYHEALPGHHLQGTLAIENTRLPLISKALFFSAHGEGWALYSEQLADEMGVYADDRFGELGYLQSLLFRASRLVADTGLHHKRWSREQAIRYMVDTGGDEESAIATEIDRYCVWPGQACSYKVGHAEWVRLREKAKSSLGDRFDIKGFHDTALATGGVPLSVLERIVDSWVATHA